MQLKSFIEIEIIWKDEDMLELKAVASNGRYFGTTEVYDSRESLTSFAKKLIDFPQKNEDVINYETGKRDGYSFLAMKFYCMDKTGHTAVQVEMEENVATTFRKEEKHKISLEIHFEANDLITFQKELEKIIKAEKGKAILNGIDKNTYNKNLLQHP